MKIQKTFVMMLSLAAFACDRGLSDMETQTGAEGADPGVVRFTTPASRASDDAWDAGDGIGVFMFGHGGTPDADGYTTAVNKHYQTLSGDGNFEAATTDEAIGYPSSGSVDFVAYYPYTDGVSGLIYPVDVTDQTNTEDIDLLYAVTGAGYTSESGAVPLSFSHALSRMNITLLEKGGNDLTGTTVSITGMKRKSSFSLADASFSDDDASTGDIAVPVVADATDQFKASGLAMVLPAAAVAGRAIAITVASTSQTYTWEIPAAQKYRSGYEYTYVLELDPVTGTVVALLGGIDGWTPDEQTVNVVVGSDRTALTKTEVGVDIYAGTVSLADNSTFTVEIGGVEYGFLAHSGHGGIGKISTVCTAEDYGFLSIYPNYSVEKSFGRLSATGGALWYNTGLAGEVDVRIDLTNEDAIPRYHLAQVNAADPSLILEERFDLITWGGGWQTGKSARGLMVSTVVSVDTRDGSEPTTAKTNNVTPHGPMNSASTDDAAYIANAGLSAWDLKQVFLWYGMVMVNNAGTEETGHIVTPALSALTAATDITVEFDILRFAQAPSAAFIVEGPGEITAATYHDVIDASVTYASAYNTNKSSDPTSVSTISGDKKSIELTSRAYNESVSAGISPTFAQQSSSHAAPKYMTRLTVSVSGATSGTTLKWTSAPGAGAYRYCIDNIRVTK